MIINKNEVSVFGAKGAYKLYRKMQEITVSKIWNFYYENPNREIGYATFFSIMDMHLSDQRLLPLFFKDPFQKEPISTEEKLASRIVY